MLNLQANFILGKEQKKKRKTKYESSPCDILCAVETELHN